MVANELSEFGNNKNSPSSSRKRRDRQTEEHVDENSYSDDMKDLMKPSAAAEASNVGGYPNRFDWVKTLRIAGGVREPQDGAPVSLSKSVQTGGGASDCLIDNNSDARASEVLEKRRPDGRRNGKRTLCDPDEMGSLGSRVSKHLLKAGLRRAPSSHWKPGPARNALRVKKKIFGSRSPRKDGGKRLRTRTLLDVNFTPYSAKVDLFNLFS